MFDLGEDGFEVPRRISVLEPEPRLACASPAALAKSTCQKMRCFYQTNEEKLGKPDAEQNLPQFSQVKFAARFNMLVPNEGFPHILQSIIILLLMSMC